MQSGGATRVCKHNSMLWTSDPCFPSGPPLPSFNSKAQDGVALSTAEILRRETFDEWDTERQQPIIRSLLRHALPRDSHVVDFCAGSGKAANFLNSTGLVTVYAFDPSADIEHLGQFSVLGLPFHSQTLRLR